MLNMVQNDHALSIPNSDFLYDSVEIEKMIKNYLKLLLHYSMEKASDRLNLPPKFTDQVKSYVDYTFENNWNDYLLYLNLIKYLALFCVLNFIFGYYSIFGIDDYFIWIKFSIRIFNFLFGLLFTLTLSLILMISKILLFFSILFYQILSNFIYFLPTIIHKTHIFFKFITIKLFIIVINLSNILINFGTKSSFILTYFLEKVFTMNSNNNSESDQKSWFRYAFENRKIFYQIIWNKASIQNKQIEVSQEQCVNKEGIFNDYLI